MKKLLIIKTGNAIPSLLSEGVDFEDWFAAGLGLQNDDCLVVSLFLDEALPALEELAGIIITGSPAYVTDEASWNHVGAEYLRCAHQQGVPVLGICYGHQLIAWAFGGEVDFHPGGREIGTADIQLSDEGCKDRLLGTLPRQFKAQVSHQQTVSRLPEDAVLLAFNEFEPHHAFRLGDTTWGMQFHPEFNAAIMAAYIRERAAAIRDEGGDPDGLLGAVQETPNSAALLRRFLALVKLPDSPV